MKEDQINLTLLEKLTANELQMPNSDRGTIRKIDPELLEKLPPDGPHRTNGDGGSKPPWRTNRLLSTFDGHQLTQLLNAGRWVTYKPNEIVSRQSEPVDVILFIVEGRARAEIFSPNNSPARAVVNLLGPGDDVGLLSLVDGGPHSATVTALMELRGLAIPFQNLQENLHPRPDRYRVLAEIAVERLRLSGAWLQALI